MKVQRHGNISAMETRPRTRQISSGCFLLSLFSAACLAVSGCGHNPPQDKNGNLPDDAVRNFIELAKANDYESAEKLWYGDSKVITGPEKFEDFCTYYERIDLKNCKISKASRGKSGFSIVNVDWEESGKKRHDSFGLKIFADEWRMERGYYW